VKFLEKCWGECSSHDFYDEYLDGKQRTMAFTKEHSKIVVYYFAVNGDQRHYNTLPYLKKTSFYESIKQSISSTGTDTRISLTAH